MGWPVMSEKFQMTLSTEYIRQKFDAFNALCFEGRLKPLPFRLSNARTFLGMVRCKRKRTRDNTWHYSDFEFIVSSRTTYAETERDIEDVILHEMIHYYILSHQIQDSGAHGAVFRRMMKEINTRFGRNISISHKRTAAELDKDREVRQHLICVSRLKSNKVGITISARTRLFELWDILEKNPQVAECQWYVSTNPYFNRFPRAMKAKIYHVPLEELREHLAAAKRLIREGDVIKICR